MAIYESKCVELGIDYEVNKVKKTDPSQKDVEGKPMVVWSQDVAFPKTTQGFIDLFGDEECHNMLIDKVSIKLRASFDPRKPEKSITIDGHKYTQSEIEALIEELKVGK